MRQDLLYVAAVIVFTGTIFSGCTAKQGETFNSSNVTLEKLQEMRYTPEEPEEAPATFQVQDGFQMTLLAGEPLVTDPVAMVYDENGRAYVAEMRDYPYTNPETAEDWEEQTNQEPLGRIRLLEDTNGDGRFDRSTVFADQLSWPTGLAVWKGGVYVTATPNIWYLKDTDGDRKADLRKKVFTGFRKFNVQAVINNPIFGLDHKLYAAGATNGGTVQPEDWADGKSQKLGRNDFRFDPKTGAFEVLSGGSRFGQSMDNWGNRFLCHIRNPVQHVVLPNQYLARNPYLVVPTAINDVAESGDQIPVYRASPPEPWRALRARRWRKDPKYSDMPSSELKAGGYWTSSSGITVYRGAAYPEEYHGDVFIGEVANNVIHRQELRRKGATFASVRADSGAEFVASTDTWFRGVNMVNAPDGTLHILDMYREVIEHPWSIPEDIRAQLDLLSGRDRGRIYRLEPPNFTPGKQPRLGQATTAKLVAELENPNGWWRDTAHRLIYERQDSAAVAPLRKLLKTSDKELARLHALWSLKGLNALSEEDLMRGLSDTSAGVRAHAVRLAEPRLQTAPSLRTQVLEMAGDSALRVRFRVAFALGEINDARVPEVLADILYQDASRSWMRIAALSSSTESSGQVMAELLSKRNVSELHQTALHELARVVGARANQREIRQVMALAAEVNRHQTLQLAVLGGLGDGLQRSGLTLRAAAKAAGSETARELVDQLFKESMQRAADDRLSIKERAAAVKLLAYEEFRGGKLKKLLGGLLVPGESQTVQMATVRTLAEFKDESVADLLLKGWGQHTPAIRREVLETVLSRTSWTEHLMGALSNGQVELQEIGEPVRKRLLNHRDDSVQNQAEALFDQDSRARGEVLQAYQKVLEQQGNPQQGAEVYEQVCQSCHQFGTTGTAVGPNLASVQHKTREEMLVHIIDPNREVSPEYVLYEVDLVDGQKATGIVAAETPNSVTLKRAGGVEETILRRNIKQVQSTGASIMPEGLEAAISPQKMADLLAYLTGSSEQ